MAPQVRQPSPAGLPGQPKEVWVVPEAARLQRLVALEPVLAALAMPAAAVAVLAAAAQAVACAAALLPAAVSALALGAVVLLSAHAATPSLLVDLGASLAPAVAALQQLAAAAWMAAARRPQVAWQTGTRAPAAAHCHPAGQPPACWPPAAAPAGLGWHQRTAAAAGQPAPSVLLAAQLLPLQPGQQKQD